MALSPATSRGGSSQPFSTVAIAQPAGTDPGFTYTNADDPTGVIEMFQDGRRTLRVRAGGAGYSRIVADSLTDTGEALIGSAFSLFQPRADANNADVFIEICDKTGADRLLVCADGSVIYAKTTVIPDANLAAGQFGFWLDATNGAAKLMVKAKQADGAVRTAAIALA